ncbi:unnamed protein product [Urochloa humidicola]
MVLNLLHDAKPHFQTTCDIIVGDPTKDFAAALDMLALKKLRLAEETKMVNSTALFASSAPSACASCRSSTLSPQLFVAQQQQGGGGGSGQQKWKKSCNRKGGGSH